MSLRHKASRHSRSSLSITWQLLSATLRTPRRLVSPHPQKANRGVVAIEQQRRTVAGQSLSLERGAAKVVGMEAEQQAMAAIRAEPHHAAGCRVNRDQRLDRRQDA